MLRAKVSYMKADIATGEAALVRLELETPLKEQPKRTALITAINLVRLDVVKATMTRDGRVVMAHLTAKRGYHFSDEGVVETARGICREANIEIIGDITPVQ